MEECNCIMKKINVYWKKTEKDFLECDKYLGDSVILKDGCLIVVKEEQTLAIYNFNNIVKVEMEDGVNE